MELYEDAKFEQAWRDLEEAAKQKEVDYFSSLCQKSTDMIKQEEKITTISRPTLPGLGEDDEEFDIHWNPSEAAATQVGGSHYQLPIQPIDYIVKNGLGYREGNVIKYVTRHKNKNELEDINKAIHYLEMIKEDYLVAIKDGLKVKGS